MRYRISVTISYDYQFPSDHARNILHLLPISVPGEQTVIDADLRIGPNPQERWDAPDFFGNQTTWISHHNPVHEIDFTLKAEIDRRAAPLRFDMSPDLAQLTAELRTRPNIGPSSPHHFLGVSPRIRPNSAITRYARDVTGQSVSVLEKVHAFGSALHKDMTFDPRATDALTPPEIAFEQKRGVCQDYAHIMIAGLRGLGVPAGYVSGFLRTNPPPGQPRLAGVDAMHAWVRAWCGPQIGWVEFDPTNDVFVQNDHITLGYGRDYVDVAPVRGSMRSSGGQASRQAVDVEPLDSVDG